MADDVTMTSTLTTDGVIAPVTAPGPSDPTPATETATARKARWGLLRQHDFRQLFLADAGSQFGVQIGMLALPLVAAVTLHASPFEMGLVAAGDTVPFVIATLPAGVLVDRMRRRPVMIACDLGRMATMAVIPVAWLLGVLAIWQVIVVAFAIGMFSAVFDVAYQSLLPTLVTKDEVVEGNSKLTSLSAVSQIGGPAVAGWIIRAVSAPYAVALNAVTYLSSAAFLGRIRTPETKPDRRADAHMGREIVEGLRYVAKQPVLRAIALEASCMNFFNAITNTLLLYLLARVLHLSSGTIGLILSIASLGGLAGALLASRVGTWVGTARVMWLVPAVTGPLWLTMPLMHRGVTLWLVAAAFTVVIGGGVIFNVTSVSFRQRLAPAHLLGRVNATMRFLILGLMPLGALVGGALGSTIGVRNTLWIACAGCALSWLPAIFSPLRTMRNMPEPETA
jgi:MFS family permease